MRRSAPCAAVAATLTAAVLTLAVWPAAPGAAGTSTLRVNRCWPDDRGAPVVDSVTVTPAAVDVTDGPATVEVALTAHDTGGPGAPTGIRRAALRLVDASRTTGYSPSLRRVGPGTWQGLLVVPQGAAPAALDWNADLMDRAGALGAFDGNARAERGGPALEVTDASPDTNAPTVTAVSIAPDHVDTTRRAATVTVSADIQDDESGVGGAYLGSRRGRVRAAGDDRLHASSDGATWTTRITIPRYAKSGTLRYGTLTVGDRAGNDATLVLADHGWTAAVQVISASPYPAAQLVRVIRRPRVTDVRRHSRWVPLRVRLTDQHGVTGATIRTDGRARPRPLHLVSGTRRHGIWAGRAREPFCAWAGGERPLSGALEVTNRAGRFKELHLALGRLLARDHLPPYGHEVHSSSATDPATAWAWDEPVRGFSSSRVPVTDEHGQPLTGHWRCRDRAGHRTSCLTGPVVRATFWQDQKPYVTNVVAVWEPAHRLSVLDLSGNPSQYESSIGPD